MDRFWSKVAIRGPDECWPWQRAKESSGYGRFRWNGRSALAHRVAHMLCNGAIEGGRRGPVVMHSCDNPSCCNPAHLSVGTHADNVADKQAKDRQPCCEVHYKTRLTSDEVRQIRADP